VRARYIIGLEGSIDPTDRGIAYGDGLFETMSLQGGIVQRFELHLERLSSGCDRLELPLPDRVELAQNIARATDGIDRGSLKLILTRGTGPRGYLPPVSPDPTVILLAEPQTEEPASEIHVATLNSRLGENETLAGIKHLNRLEQVLARLELSHLDADEGLMLSTRGVVIGGISRNLFAVFGDSIATPVIDRAGIAGVMRRSVLEQCVELNINANQRELSPQDLHSADELFMTNALVGIQSVTRLDRTEFATHKIASRLRQAIETSGNGRAGHG
jgi:4-amino-4-deoxychorismate lyase